MVWWQRFGLSISFVCGRVGIKDLEQYYIPTLLALCYFPCMRGHLWRIRMVLWQGHAVVCWNDQVGMCSEQGQLLCLVKNLFHVKYCLPTSQSKHYLRIPRRLRRTR